MRKMICYLVSSICLMLFPVAIAFAQNIDDYLVVNDIEGFIASKNPSLGQGPGLLVGTDHFYQDHADKTAQISYFNLDRKLGVEVQVTQHTGGDSDQWLLHEVERGFRRGDYEENMTPTRFRTINNNNIFYSGLGGGTYRWISNDVVVNIEYTDLYKEKTEPQEIIDAYLAKFPSTIHGIAIDSAHDEKWIKDEMERRLWLCDKWFSRQEAGNEEIRKTLKEVVDHMNIFLDYRDKYYGISADAEKQSLYLYLKASNTQGIKDKLAENKSWWQTNKSGSINLP